MSNKMKDSKNKLLIRIVISPIAFMWGIILLLSPLSAWATILITVGGLVGLVFYPLLWLIRKGGIEIRTLEDGDRILDSEPLTYFLCLTIYLWLPFYSSYLFIKKGELMFINN